MGYVNIPGWDSDTHLPEQEALDALTTHIAAAVESTPPVTAVDNGDDTITLTFG